LVLAQYLEHHPERRAIHAGRHDNARGAELDGKRWLPLDQTAWLSRTILPGRGPALRACVTSYETKLDDIDALVRSIEHAPPG
jgi:hypothetical protein